MDIGHDTAVTARMTTMEGSAGSVAFVYEVGRTLTIMPFTDLEEEAAWDRAVDERFR